MINCKFDFINDTLPPRHNKNAEEYAKQQMHKIKLQMEHNKETLRALQQCATTKS